MSRKCNPTRTPINATDLAIYAKHFLGYASANELVHLFHSERTAKKKCQQRCRYQKAKDIVKLVIDMGAGF
jgi:hypothetical protein